MSFLGNTSDPLKDNYSTSSQDANRTRTLTEKGMELYTSSCKSHKEEIERKWSDVDNILSSLVDHESDILRLRSTEKRLVKIYDNYRTSSMDFIAFLTRNDIQESRAELKSHTEMEKIRETGVEDAITLLDQRIQQALEAVSRHSGSSRKSAKSNKSNTSSVLAQTQVRAQAARARVEFALKETGLRKQRALIDCQKAELEADLDLLQQQKEVAVTEAEISVLKLVADGGSSRYAEPKVPCDNTMDRTRQYVAQHSNLPTDTFCELQLPQTSTFNNPIVTSGIEYGATKYDFDEPSDQHRYPNQDPRNYRRLNPLTPPFIPYQHKDDSRAAVTSELTQFLLKKELLLARFTHFNDTPESYAIWKSGFHSITSELQVSAREEMDLLVKWLGPDSGKHAVSLRASNVNDPKKGLYRIWERLDDRFGSPEMVEASLKTKLNNFPKLSNRDNKKLYDLSDLLAEIESIKEDKKFSSLLAYFDSSSGVIPIVSKLPYGLQEKWTTKALNYKKKHGVSFPPFTFFVDFIRDISKAKNDPSFNYEVATPPTQKTQLKTNQPRNTIFTKKTEVAQQPPRDALPHGKCPLHHTNHSLNECKGFRSKPLYERKQLIRQYGICYKCCNSTTHLADACKENIKCTVCETDRHATALHVSMNYSHNKSPSLQAHGGKKTEIKDISAVTPSTKCTQICGENFFGKSCAKTILVRVYPKGQQDKSTLMYVILDDQSNVSLAKPGFFELLNITSDKKPYTLSSCAGNKTTHGRRAYNCVVESLEGNTTIDLPYLIECEDIPDLKQEIPTPQVAQAYPHLQDLAHFIPPLNNSAPILLLIGRDVLEAHHVMEQRIGPHNTPFAQKMKLGWVIIGESCLGRVHKPELVTVSKTNILPDGRPSIFQLCPNSFKVKDNIDYDTLLSLGDVDSHFGKTVFEKTKNDERPGTSIEDKSFVSLMEAEMIRGPGGNWIAPLPFRQDRPRLANNRPQALKRALTLDRSLNKDPIKKQHMVTFMEGILDKGHAEIAPAMSKDDELWYLPIFGIYHPKKPDQIRAVFDSSAKYNGISLNDVLLTGPDLTNSLMGILLRFRQEPVAMTADVQQMFYCFHVREDHRNYLRFLWYRNNDPEQDLIDYRMCVHVFGNSPSPAVATYGMRRATQTVEHIFGKDTTSFVENNFYVDDGVISLPSPDQAIDLMKRTQQALQTGGNLKLHKIASNSTDVLQAFPAEDLAKELKNLDFDTDDMPCQRSLGLIWNLKLDTFTFRVSSDIKPYTKRGILSTVNSIFDPLGFVAPVVLQGKIMLRELIPNTKDWDEPLPKDYENEWDEWRNSLSFLEQLNIPRSYLSVSMNDTVKKEIHIYCDASEKAIAAVAYLKTFEDAGITHVGFVLGKAKLAPVHGHTIPRLELCAAVLAVEISDVISEQLEITPDNVFFYTDSRVVMGYINNQTRRFYIYVTNRVDRIRRSSDPKQWSYVSTEQNPADCATRPLPAGCLKDSTWLLGPARLVTKDNSQILTDSFPLVNPNEDKEIRQPTTLLSAISEPTSLGSHRFERFSSWKQLVKSIAHLKHVAQSYNKNYDCKSWHIGKGSRSVDLFNEAELHIIREVQREVFHEEISCILKKSCLPRSSLLSTLSPYLDRDGLLRVGGRLNNAQVSDAEKNPLIVPGRHHIATLLVRHHHQAVRHQGRHYTEGAIRAAGLWIIGGKRLISSILHKCVHCRRQRGATQHQKMADLPVDRLQPSPPFTYVGVDAFGPWNVIARRTRGGLANVKRWAVIFSCLTSRAVHIEVVEQMTSSSFINALRRFISIRGDVKQFRSDRGTNFVGAVKELDINAINVEDGPISDFLCNKKVTWIFNPPHSSHMGGAWERMIGLTRRILDSIMAEASPKNLTHEVLVTFMAEVCAVINNRPITPVSSDPEHPEILSPSILLTQKTSQAGELNLDWNIQDLYKSQWKRVQALADTFWKRWRREYIHTLQARRMWQCDRPNVKNGDLVMLKDPQLHRNNCPCGLVTRTIPGKDSKIRKAEVRLIKDGTPSIFTRPITEMVVLLSSEKDNV